MVGTSPTGTSTVAESENSVCSTTRIPSIHESSLSGMPRWERQIRPVGSVWSILEAESPSGLIRQEEIPVNTISLVWSGSGLFRKLEMELIMIFIREGKS